MTGDFLDVEPVGEVFRKMKESLVEREPEKESVPLWEAHGRILASDIISEEDLPGFDRSQVDGYAICAKDSAGASESNPSYLKITGEVLMGEIPKVSVQDGVAVRIHTGGVLPDGADAVLMLEDSEEIGEILEVKKAIAPGENVVSRDDDIARGTLVAGRGTKLNPAHIGALAGLGKVEVEVFRKPVVGVISTGDELLPPEEEVTPGKVRDINSSALCAAVRSWGCEAVFFGIVRDEKEAILRASRRALDSSDALLISGGSSKGAKDATLDVVSMLGKPGVISHGIGLKPGKPTICAICDGKPVFGLPGNPASALVVAMELVRPILLVLKGEREMVFEVSKFVEARFSAQYSSEVGREEIVFVVLKREEGMLIADPVFGKSNLIGSLARSEGFVRIPAYSEGLEKGAKVKVELF